MDSNGRATLREVIALLQRVEDKIDDLRDRTESRLDSLERWRSFLAGALAILSVGFSVAVSLLT